MYFGPFSSYEEYLKELERFHGKKAPGGVLALHMVSLARELLPEGILMDVICETRKCLADAIQLLTPCTVGNHWLKIVDTGRFAGVFYDKQTGEGVRISLSMERLEDWPRVREWYLKLIPKHEQSLEAILDQINEAGQSLFRLKSEIWPLVPMEIRAERSQSLTMAKKPAWLSPTAWTTGMPSGVLPAMENGADGSRKV